MSAMSDFTAETRLLAGNSGVLPRVNLLPPEIAEAARFRKVQAGLAGVVVAAVAATGLLYVGATGGVTEGEEAVSEASSEQSTLTAQSAQFANVTDVYAAAEAAQAMLVEAMGQEVRYSRFLNDLSLSIPEDVWITDLSFSQSDGATVDPTAAAGAELGLGTVTVTGVAFEHDDVATWLESLARQEGYTAPYLTSSTKELLGKQEIVNWSTTTVLTPAALSGRYTTVTGG